MLDMAKTEYTSLLCKGVAAMPTLLSTFATLTTISSVAQEGWALKESKKSYRFNKNKKATWRQSLMLARQQEENLIPK